MEEKKVDIKPSFCIMPWVHFYVAQNGNVTPCCQAPPQKVHRFGNVNEQGIAEIWSGEEINAFRKKLLSGEKDIRCQQCYTKEAEGVRSMRQNTNQKYSDQVTKIIQEKTLHSEAPTYFDIRFSNACNLKCRICGPWASSQWHKDAVALGMRKKGENPSSFAIKNEDSFFEELTPFLSSATEFYFAGGEPLLMEQHYRVLSALIACENTDIRLEYNTNFSTLQYKEYQVIDYWKHFSNVHVAASLDAEGEKGELLRKNLNWNKVLANRKRLQQEAPHVSFKITPTVCVFNVAHLPEFHRNWVAEGLIQVEDFVPNMLIHPKEYHINLLPVEEQQRIKLLYQEHLEWIDAQKADDQKRFDAMRFQFNSIIELLDTPSHPNSTHKFIQRTQQLDQLRKENSAKTFPELAPIFDKS